VAGAELVSLLGELDARDGCQFAANEFSPIADDGDESLDPGSEEGIDDVADHWSAGDRNENLRQLRLHASSFPGGKDDRHGSGNGHFFEGSGAKQSGFRARRLSCQTVRSAARGSRACREGRWRVWRGG
jgi:hypothetical protein